MDKLNKQGQVVDTNFTDNEPTAMEPVKTSEGKVKKVVKRVWKYAVVAVLSAAGGYVLGRKSHGSNGENETIDYDPAYEESQEIPEE